MNKIIKSIFGFASAVVVLVRISPIGVWADDYSGRAWTTYSYAPGAEKTFDTVELYVTDKEYYKWSVNSIQQNGCTYSCVELGCNNGNITMRNNVNKRMSVCGNKYFDVIKTGAGTYMVFIVNMIKDSYGPVYNGRIDIVK